MYQRWFASEFQTKLSRPFVHVLFGARQTGKSTLLGQLLPADAIKLDLANPAERNRYLQQPDRLISLCQALPRREEVHTVFVDEVQAVPQLFDAVQHLYDGDKTRWRFVLCGSSARKLRTTGANLLPGRSFLHKLLPLVLQERPSGPNAGTVLPLSEHASSSSAFPSASLLERLSYGDLPGVVTAEEEDRQPMLQGYAVLHLEEEVRREGLVKDWGKFQRFVQLAAHESGQIINYTAISKDSALAQPTVKAHYQLMEDMFLGFSLPAWTQSPRKQLLSTPRFFMFDLGLRHAAAGLEAGPNTVLANPGPIFEQWVGIELWKRLQYLGRGRLSYMRSKDGAEVDFILEYEDWVTPIEVKWTENPTASDARHLKTFLAENPDRAKRGYIICRCDRPLQILENVVALPWNHL
jgi:uncharacterized protein